MDQIKFKNTLSSFVSENYVIGKLVTKIKKALPGFTSLKLDVELTLYVAKCLKTEFAGKTDEQIKTMVITTISQIHPLNPAEIAILNSQMQFLIDHSKVIPTSRFKSIFNLISSCFFKKFG